MNRPPAIRTALATLLMAVAVSGALSACSGGSTPTPSGSKTGSGTTTTSPTSTGDPALALAKAVIAAGSAASTTPAPELGSVILSPPLVTEPIRIAVTRLTAAADQTVLQLSASMVNPGTSAIPKLFSPEASYRLGDLAPARFSNWVSVVDRSSDTVLFPYQYRSQPTSPARLACTCMSEPLLRQQPQTWTLVLPPLPSTSTTADVTIPRGLTDSAGLASKAVATIKGVAITRS